MTTLVLLRLQLPHVAVVEVHLLALSATIALATSRRAVAALVHPLRMSLRVTSKGVTAISADDGLEGLVDKRTADVGARSHARFRRRGGHIVVLALRGRRGWRGWRGAVAAALGSRRVVAVERGDVCEGRAVRVVALAFELRFRARVEAGVGVVVVGIVVGEGDVVCSSDLCGGHRCGQVGGR